MDYTYLELCQAVARRAGIGGTGPTSVVGQSGEYQRVVDWVRQAWEEIQMLHQEWYFRWGRFTVSTTGDGTDEYGICESGIEAINDKTLTIYKNDDGVSTKQPLQYLPYDEFVTLHGRRYAEDGTPWTCTMLPNFALKVYPPPDDVYVIQGDFVRDIQVLAADADEPYVNGSHRLTILFRAMMLYAEHEEATGILATEAAEYNNRLNRMRRVFLPQIRRHSEPLV